MLPIQEAWLQSLVEEELEMQLKILHATTKTRSSQVNKYYEKKKEMCSLVTPFSRWKD